MVKETIRPGSLIAITGGSGFIGSWITDLLLQKGYRVRVIVRDLKKEENYAHLKSVSQKEDQLQFAEGDFDTIGYDDAVKDCDGVLHVASPYVYSANDPQKEIVEPAIKGIRTLMASAAKASSTVKRVIVTSSGGAILHFPVENGYTFNDNDWNTSSSLTNNPYFYSKKLAEEEAWDLWRNQYKNDYDFAVVNPLLVFGPIKAPKLNASQMMFKKILLGENPQVQSGTIGYTDVRDVAQAHLIALEHPEAVGKRLICATGVTTWKKIVVEMKKQHPEFPVTIAVDDEQPTFQIDNSTIKGFGMTDFRPLESVIRDTIDSFISFGLVQPDHRQK